MMHCQILMSVYSYVGYSVFVYEHETMIRRSWMVTHIRVCVTHIRAGE